MLSDFNLKSAIIIPSYCPDKNLLDLIYEIRLKMKDNIIVVIDDGNTDEYQYIFNEIKNMKIYLFLKKVTDMNLK